MSITIQSLGDPGSDHGHNLRFLVVTRKSIELTLLPGTRCILEDLARPGLRADLSRQTLYRFAGQVGVKWKTARQIKAVVGSELTGAVSPCYATVGEGRRALLLVTTDPLALTLLSGVNVLLEEGTAGEFREWLEIVNLAKAAGKYQVSANFMLAVKQAVLQQV